MRVLIAEDHALLRDGLTRLLRDHGHEVVAAVDGPDDIVRRGRALKPDLALLDVRLPPTFTDEGVRAAPPSPARRSSCCRSTWSGPTPESSSPTARAASGTC